MSFVEQITRHRKRDDFDALFAQLLHFVRLCLAADFAIRRLPIVDLARLFGKRVADVLGIRDQVLDEPGDLVVDIGVLSGRAACLRLRLLRFDHAARI